MNSKVMRVLPVFAVLLFLTTPVPAMALIVAPTHFTKEVALSFDDGPYGTSTQAVIHILQENNVPATFFMVGQQVIKYPDLAREIAHDGYEIGNHTYSHPRLDHLSTPEGLDQVRSAEVAIASTTGVSTQLFRPPYGILPEPLRVELQYEGYKTIMWNSDPRDWDKNITSSQIIQRILSQKKPHMVIDLHDGRDTHVGYPRDNLIGALPRLIQDLKRQGYTFVTVSQIGQL